MELPAVTSRTTPVSVVSPNNNFIVSEDTKPKHDSRESISIRSVVMTFLE
jgi:hypothetical protein